ncbi:porin family protein [Paraliomyxa miuraensis]|uniref:hypothetical protein n=1 Tax=Paraliomyxa miuraensis TaxID=376150 RepID=UPI0022530EC0|nr:hypothetical protein [Paraliomyxa miuraensis]MCX4246658.1 hypothetical protein [Paraliomyxa miuraensis]
MERALHLAAIAVLLGLPCSAAAAEPIADEAAPDESSQSTGDRTDRPWIVRWTPESNQIEAGIYGGVLLPSRRVELFEADFGLADQGYRPFARVAPDLGLRAGYFPSRWFGVEAEGGVMPTHAEPRGRAVLWTARGSVVGQLGRRDGWSVTPFGSIGGGLLGVRSSREVVGNDVDAAMHLGAGVKIYFNRFTALRLDVRDLITARQGYKDGLSHNAEILLGMTVTLGRASRPAGPS